MAYEYIPKCPCCYYKPDSNGECVCYWEECPSEEGCMFKEQLGAWLPSSWFEKEKDMEQCTAMAMKPRYSKKGAVAMFLGYERGQCSRKAKVGSLCTQHTRMKARWAARK